MMNDIFFGGYGNIIEIQLHKSLAKSLICLGSRRRRQGGQEMSLHDHPRQYALSPKKFMGFMNGYWHLVAGNNTNHICQLETTLLFSASMFFLRTFVDLRFRTYKSRNFKLNLFSITWKQCILQIKYCTPKLNEMKLGNCVTFLFSVHFALLYSISKKTPLKHTSVS